MSIEVTGADVDEIFNVMGFERRDGDLQSVKIIVAAWEVMSQKHIPRLMALAVAVGHCQPDEVPEPVRKAWREPDKYREDELNRMRDEIQYLENRLAAVGRMADQIRSVVDFKGGEQ